MEVAEISRKEWDSLRLKKTGDLTKEKEHKEWKEMSKEEKVKKLKNEKELELLPEEKKARRLEKAEVRRRNWKEWREEDEDFEIDQPSSPKITENQEIENPKKFFSLPHLSKNPAHNSPLHPRTTQKFTSSNPDANSRNSQVFTR